MAKAQACTRAKAPIALARHSNLRPAAGYGTARAGLPRRYCHPGVEGYRTRRRPRQALPLPLMDDYAKTFGLAGEEAAAGLEEAGRGLVHPFNGGNAGRHT
jgi:hypothetical protein